MDQLPLLLSIAQVIGLDILLSGDNAVVIAMACRGLPDSQRRWGVICGAGAAVVLRILLVMVSLTLFDLPGVKIVGAILLAWIGFKLASSSDDGEPDIKGNSKLLSAIKTVVLADLVMSFDNVAAIAGVADGAGPHRLVIVIVGLLVSIPLVVAGSHLIMKLMTRFPWIVLAGAALLGWLAGTMLVTDSLFDDIEPWIGRGLGIVTALVILALSVLRNQPQKAHQ